MDPGNRRISLIVQYLEKPVGTVSESSQKLGTAETGAESLKEAAKEPAKESEKH